MEGSLVAVSKMVIAEPKDIEAALSETIIRVAEIHERMQSMEAQMAMIPEVKVLLGNVAVAQQVMASSAQSMADTFRKSEQRQERAELRYEALTQIAAGKDQIPLRSHYWTLFAALVPCFITALVVVLYTLAYNKQSIEATINKLAVTTKDAIHEGTKEVRSEVQREK